MAKIYIKPEKELIKYTCPHCGTISQMEKDFHHFQSDCQSSSTGRGIVVHNRLTIHRCQCCGRKIIWIDKDYEKQNIEVGSILGKFVIPELVKRGLM